MLRMHTDLILGRAEVVEMHNTRCLVRILTGPTAGVCHWLPAVNLQFDAGVGAEGRLVLRATHDTDVQYILLPD